MSDIVARLRAVTLDKDNFPRMDSERWLPVGLAREAAAEIERLLSERNALKGALVAMIQTFGTPRRDEWINDAAFEYAKAVHERATRALEQKE